MARQDVLNAGRASNAEMPRSAAVARQLDEAAQAREGAVASAGGGAEWYRERAWTRVGMARDAMAEGGGERNADREAGRFAREPADYAAERTRGMDAARHARGTTTSLYRAIGPAAPEGATRLFVPDRPLVEARADVRGATGQEQRDAARQRLGQGGATRGDDPAANRQNQQAAVQAAQQASRRQQQSRGAGHAAGL